MKTISLEGMYDLHVHSAPSVQKRRFTSLEAVKSASAERMGGLILKDHTYHSTPMTDTINEMGLHAKAFGAIMLNEAVGGVSPSVVEIALALGAKEIEMPTYSSKGHFDAYGDDQKIFPYKKRVKPIFILDDRGRLLPEAEEIINLVKSKGAFLATGHLSSVEVDALVRCARETGCKILVSSVSTDMPGYPLDYQKQWASDHIFMEHDYAAVTDMPHVPASIETVVAQIRAVGAERCVIASDAGNMKLPDNVSALREFVRLLVEAGIADKEIDVMARRNPRILLEVP